MSAPTVRLFDDIGDGTGSTDTRVPDDFKILLGDNEGVSIHVLVLYLSYIADGFGYEPSHWAGDSSGLTNGMFLRIFKDGVAQISDLNGVVSQPVKQMGDLQLRGARRFVEEDKTPPSGQPVFASFYWNCVELFGTPLLLRPGMELRLTVQDDIQATCDDQVFCAMGNTPALKFDGTVQQTSLPRS